MVDAFNTAVGARVVGACGDFVDTEAVVEREREFGTNLKRLVGKESDGKSPERDVSVDEDVGRAGSGELGLCSGVHVGTAAETVGEQEGVGVAPRRLTGRSSPH